MTQHPLERTVCDFWRMIWEQESRLIVTLSSIDSQECRPFWPAIIGETLALETNKRDQQMRLTLLEEVDTLARRAIRLNLELVSFQDNSAFYHSGLVFLWPRLLIVYLSGTSFVYFVCSISLSVFL